MTHVALPYSEPYNAFMPLPPPQPIHPQPPSTHIQHPTYQPKQLAQNLFLTMTVGFRKNSVSPLSLLFTV